MSTKTSTNTHDNKREDDELEDEFLKCDIDSFFPSPNEKLENYQFELREIMKSGCNLQIAEYSLLQCNIFSHLDSAKKNYDKKLGPILVLMENRIQIYFGGLGDKQNNQKKNDDQNQTENEEEEEEEPNKEYKYYEEEIDTIMEKHAEELEKYSQMELDKIKKDWMKIFYELVEESGNKESFKEAKKNYIEKRTSLIDSALRLVKKIVNDDNEYQIFYKNYFGKNNEKDNK